LIVSYFDFGDVGTGLVDQGTYDDQGNFSQLFSDGSSLFIGFDGQVSATPASEGSSEGFGLNFGDLFSRIGAGATKALSGMFMKKNAQGQDELDLKQLATIAGGLGGLLGIGNRPSQPVGYQGGIPKYTAMREAIAPPAPKEGEPARRPGSSEQRYLSDVEFKPVAAAGGGLMGLAKGRYLGGATDGMADKINTSIDGKQPAALSHGEFVIPADVVSHLGNGNSQAGAQRLYEMMDRIRKARTGTTKQGRQINPNKHLPA